LTVEPPPDEPLLVSAVGVVEGTLGTVVVWRSCRIGLPLPGTGIRLPVPSSSQHRFPLDVLPSRPSEKSVLSPLFPGAVGCADHSGGLVVPPSGQRWWSRLFEAAAGPAPETGGGTEEVPRAGPGGGPS
jgi:hypothetical protein